MLNNFGYFAGGAILTALAIPILIIALLIMLPARAVVAVKRTVS